MFMKILLLFMCSSVGNVFCSLWKLVFTTKLQTNNCQLQLTGYYIDDSCYNYSFHIQLCYIFSIFSQKFFSIFSMVPESKKFFPSLIMSWLSPCTLVFYLCQFFHPPPIITTPRLFNSRLFQAPRLLPPPFYSGLQSRLLYLAFSANLGLLCMPHPGMGPLV